LRSGLFQTWVGLWGKPGTRHRSAQGTRGSGGGSSAGEKTRGSWSKDKLKGGGNKGGSYVGAQGEGEKFFSASKAEEELEVE